MKTYTANQVRLGFIGVGSMGSRLVRRLLGAGYQLTVFDRNQANAEALRKDGASVAASAAELVESADIVLSCLTNDEAVLTVYLGPNGILSLARSGKVVLEMSTVSSETSRKIYAEGTQRGVNVMDVAISGSTPAVERGTITLLAGGDAQIFQAAEPIFKAIAQQYFLMGHSGAGTSMKLVVNTLLGVGMQAIAEAITLGEAEGLPRERLLDVLSHTAVIASAHVGKLTSAERRDYNPQFPVGLMNKDFRLILDAADSLNLVLPATAAAFKVNSAAFEEDPTSDFSSVIRHMERTVELTIPGK